MSGVEGNPSGDKDRGPAKTTFGESIPLPVATGGTMDFLLLNTGQVEGPIGVIQHGGELGLRVEEADGTGLDAGPEQLPRAS